MAKRRLGSFANYDDSLISEKNIGTVLSTIHVVSDCTSSGC